MNGSTVYHRLLALKDSPRQAADVLKKAQEPDYTEHKMLPLIEKFKSMKSLSPSRSAAPRFWP